MRDRTFVLETAAGPIRFRPATEVDVWIALRRFPLPPLGDGKTEAITGDGGAIVAADERDKLDLAIAYVEQMDELMIRCAKAPRLRRGCESTPEVLDVEELPLSDRKRIGAELLEGLGLDMKAAREAAFLQTTETP